MQWPENHRSMMNIQIQIKAMFFLFVCICKHSLLPKGLIPVRYVIESDASDTVFNIKMHSKYQIDFQV